MFETIISVPVDLDELEKDVKPDIEFVLQEPNARLSVLSKILSQQNVTMEHTARPAFESEITKEFSDEPFTSALFSVFLTNLGERLFDAALTDLELAMRLNGGNFRAARKAALLLTTFPQEDPKGLHRARLIEEYAPSQLKNVLRVTLAGNGNLPRNAAEVDDLIGLYQSLGVFSTASRKLLEDAARQLNGQRRRTFRHPLRNFT